MREVVAEIIIIVLLVLANGFLAMSELAIVSVRKARFRKSEALGHRFEVADMDRHRVHKVIVQRLPPTAATPTQPEGQASGD